MYTPVEWLLNSYKTQQNGNPFWGILGGHGGGGGGEANYSGASPIAHVCHFTYNVLERFVNKSVVLCIVSIATPQNLWSLLTHAAFLQTIEHVR